MHCDFCVLLPVRRFHAVPVRRRLRFPGPGCHWTYPKLSKSCAAKFSRQNVWGSVDFAIRRTASISRREPPPARWRPVRCCHCRTHPNDVHTQLLSIALGSGSYVRAPTGIVLAVWGHCGHPALFNRTMGVTKRLKSAGAEHTQECFGGVAAVPFV
jgi:hypothetical protein